MVLAGEMGSRRDGGRGLSADRVVSEQASLKGCRLRGVRYLGHSLQPYAPAPRRRSCEIGGRYRNSPLRGWTWSAAFSDWIQSPKMEPALRAC